MCAAATKPSAHFQKHNSAPIAHDSVVSYFLLRLTFDLDSVIAFVASSNVISA
jgi:hypothetical protein